MINKLARILGNDAVYLRGLIVALFIGAVLQGLAFTLLVPILRALLSGDYANVWTWIWIELAVLFVYGIMHYGAKVWSLKVSLLLSGNLWRRLGDHIVRLPLGWFDGKKTGQIARLSSHGVLNVMGLPMHLLRPLMDAFVTPAVAVAAMFLFDWQLAVIMLVTAPFIAIAYRLSGMFVQKIDHQGHEASVRTTNRLIEFAQTQPVLRAFGRMADGNRMLDDAFVAQRVSDRKFITYGGVFGQSIFQLAVQAAFTVILLAGIARTLDASIGPIELVAILTLATRYVQPMLDGGVVGGSLRPIRNNLNRMDQILATPTLPETTSGFAVKDASVEFENVSFGYDEREVLHRVSFRAAPRTMTALVGPSGSGKTTITRLVGRFWDVQSGTVRVGDSDVRELATDELMAQLSFVFQDVYLFAGTIRENIRMAKPDATEEEMAEAIKLARVDELIARLPDGLDAQVGEGGSLLSGGERQRVSIARAMLKDAPIVLLDEA